MKIIIRIFVLLFTCCCTAQFSKTHYIPPLSNSDFQEPQGQFMYISSPSLTPVNFKIMALGGAITEGTVSRDVPYVFNIGFGFDTQLMISRSAVNTIRSNKGYIIEAEDLVYVTVRLTTTPDHFQGGGVVSKGLASLGKEFRVGAFLNTSVAATSEFHYTFASVLATENNTIVSFSDIEPGVTLINNFTGNTPPPVTLNAGESYVIAVQGPSTPNRDGLVGMLITSTKDIAVNCGSIAGTNGDNNLDIGIDQIVGVERTGTRYIFVKGNGNNLVEKPLIIAHGPGPTDVFLNGNSGAPVATLQPGEYLGLNGNQFDINGNMYIETSQKVFAYQGIGGSDQQANQNMCFVPPLNCQTPKIIDNIPLINQIGNNTSFIATVNVVTETGATLSFVINGIAYTPTTLPQGITVSGPISVPGAADYETYKFEGLTGNISVYSTKQVYVSYFGSSGAATYGGFYSGFTFKPEVSFNPLEINSATDCIPNVELKVNALTAFDDFQWYFNDVVIAGATLNSYIPTEISAGGLGPGFYHVKATISACLTELISDKIPVSSCPQDTDNDQVNNNIDIDSNNDGVTNCDQSYGNIGISLTGSTGTVQSPDGLYSNAYTTSQTTTGTTAAAPFTGTFDGQFVTATASGLNTSVTNTVSFAAPVSVVLTYAEVAAAADLLSSDGTFIVRVPVDRTVTILNPDDQLVIDTNYDGVYESGITRYSSFEIRFRLNNAFPLAAGTGTFEFRADNVLSFSYQHSNLSETAENRATFRLMASCVPRDTDLDGIPDHLDYDIDNDGIPNQFETMSAVMVAAPFTDVNQNGRADTFDAGLPAIDTDGDGIPDYLDLDSDNDGIYDLIEAGHSLADINLDGRIDAASFGTNGLADILETTPGSNTINYTLAESDATDGLQNFRDTDSDDDACNDVVEAGYSDADNDGFLGNSPVTVDANGRISSAADGYTLPADANYTTPAPIEITVQPADRTSCAMQDISFEITTSAVDGYQWQVSTDGINYTDISDNALYSGAATSTLLIVDAPVGINNNRYRVFLSKNGNTCGLLSAPATLTILDRPVVPPSIVLKQCDDDLDGLSDFNLRQLESLISSNAANEIFTYYTSLTGAENADAAALITNTTAYNNSQGSTVWVRIENPNDCYNITEMSLVVSATQIPVGTAWSFAACDDFLDANGNNNADNDDRDGITTFDFSSVTADINTLLAGNPNYTISYYRNEAEALAETDAAGNSLAITNISSYRNIGYPGIQSIYVRVDSNVDNACFGLGPYITLVTEELPLANPVVIPRLCDRDITDSAIDAEFDTSDIENQLLQGQTGISVTYFNADGTALPSPLPNPFLTESRTVTARLTNNNTATPDNIPCFDEITFDFIVDTQPSINAIMLPEQCDDLPDDADGRSAFDTTFIESTLLGIQTGVTVRYIAEDGSALPSPLPNPFVTSSQVITAIIENPLNPNCSASSQIEFIVNPLPEVDADITADDPVIICAGTPNERVAISAGLLSGASSNYSYSWTFNGTPIADTMGNMHTIDEAGVYTVTITDRRTGCFRIRTIHAEFSSIAVITEVVIKDLSENNSVEVLHDGQGDYEYSLGEIDGPYQDSPIFRNVTPGFHTVFVRDRNECGIDSQEIAVMGAPQFFTPNGDSYNDTWRITGMNPAFNKDGRVYIFDRFGKLVMEIPTGTDVGWDGSYNGSPMPADDYWYVLTLSDGRTARGHFSLKR